MSSERRQHERWIERSPRPILERMRADLAKKPPSDEWYVKRWWRLRRDAVCEALDDLDMAEARG